MNSNKIIFITGVSGSGKSTIGSLLAKDLSVPYFDGDDFHSKENITKMSSGKSLNDEDRDEWLVTLNMLAKKQLNTSSGVIACSALKQKYRDVLSAGIEDKLQWVYLFGTFEHILDRLNQRSNHFMPPDLLRTQFDILDNPKDALHIDTSLNPTHIVETIKDEFVNRANFGSSLVAESR